VSEVDPGYSQEEQAEGYASFALYHYALFEWELRQFVTECGGLWPLLERRSGSRRPGRLYMPFR